MKQKGVAMPPADYAYELLEGVDEGARAGVLEELREGPGMVEQGVNHLQQWFRRQPHLPQPGDGAPLDAQVCKVFLRGCKHDLERAKKKIDAYYTARAAVPLLFTKRDPRAERLQRAMDLMEVFPLPRLTPSGHRVTLHRMRPSLLKELRASNGPSATGPPLDVVATGQLLFLVGEVRIQEEPGPFAGDIMVVDFAGFGPSHCAQVIAAAGLVRDGLVSVQEAFPQRMTAVLMLNMHPAMEKALALMKAFMKEKVRSRFQAHSTIESLHKFIPREMFPRDMGGEEDRDLASAWRAKLEAYGPWLIGQDCVVADESRRPAPADNCKAKAAASAAQLFGCEGSFRRLAID